MKNEETFTAPMATVILNTVTITRLELERGIPFAAQSAHGPECELGASPAEALFKLFESLGGVVN